MSLKEALEVMRRCKATTREKFSIEYVSADLKRLSGGNLVAKKNCYTVRDSHDGFEHGTVNIMSDSDLHPVPVHIRLIMKLNGRVVD